MKFLIAGGDKRTVELLKLLKEDGHSIITYGLENNNNQLEALLTQEFDAIIGPIPFTTDGKNLNAPFAKNKIPINEFLKLLKNQTLIAGAISTEIKEKNIKIIDILECEDLVIYNTIATAEGTIKIAIENTEKNLHESKILILGFGRVAKTLAVKLKGLSNRVTCAARKPKDLAWIDTLGFNVQDINNLDLTNFDIIINTVPQIILTDKRLQTIANDSLIIDLASKPGGIDKEALKKTNLKYIWALGLPGKVAPLSSAQYIKNAIYSIL